jgi:small subunit ribosomal protein S7
MSRKSKSRSRILQPDPKYKSLLVGRFINNMFWDGKRTVGQKVFYNTIALVEKKTKEDGFALFQRAINNVKPVLEVRPRRVGGATYQIPMEVPAARRETLAIKWLIRAARARAEYRMVERLANELIDAAKNQGAAIKKKEETHKMAEANRAFAHYRW